MLTGLRKRRLPVALVAALAGLLFAAAVVVASSKPQPPLSYSAWSASSVEAEGCLGKRGLYTELSATVKTRVKPAELRKLAEKNRPRDASVTVGGNRYRLKIDSTASVTGNGQVIWGFKRTRINAKTAGSLIGEKATIHYKIDQKSYKTKPVSTRDGRCKSLI